MAAIAEQVQQRVYAWSEQRALMDTELLRRIEASRFLRSASEPALVTYQPSYFLPPPAQPLTLPAPSIPPATPSRDQVLHTASATAFTTPAKRVRFELTEQQPPATAQPAFLARASLGVGAAASTVASSPSSSPAPSTPPRPGTSSVSVASRASKAGGAKASAAHWRPNSALAARTQKVQVAFGYGYIIPPDRKS